MSEVEQVDCSTCIADLSGDGVVEVMDIIAIIEDWGDCPANSCCPSDLVVDGVIEVNDLLVIIAAWGTNCSPEPRSLGGPPSPGQK
jgi:hypothetical protein